jgi:uncharacterized protein YdgA (DUF945 family)
MMKPWVVVLLVLLALVVLVSPGIVGRLAEKNVESSIERAAQGTPDIAVTEQTFDRGWFTSEGRQRIELRDERLRQVLADLFGPAREGAVPALIVATHLDHGIIPVTSMSRESGSLMPGIASTVSTLAFDSGNGELIEIPGKVFSRIGLSGASVSRYALEAGAVDGDTTHIEWSGADATVRADAAWSSLGFEASVEPLVIDAGGESIHVESISVAGTQESTIYGFNVGTIEAELGAVTVAVPGAPSSGFESLTFSTSTELVDERMNGRSRMDIADLGGLGTGEMDLNLDLVVNRFDAASMQAILRALEEAQASSEPDDALAVLYPQIEDELQAFLAAGAEVRFDRLDVTLPQGSVSSRLRFELPATDPSQFSWPGMLLALNASADVTVPAALVDMAQAVNPQAGMLVAMGVLRKEGDVYRVEAEYAKGLLTVNGAPMPIPLPAAR